MEPETAGDPMSGLKWTRKTTKKISKQLESVGTSVSSTTVGEILKKLGFSLKSNVKKISSGGKSMTLEEQEKRNKQFEYINKLRCQSHHENFPEISVDTKKKELIGNFKNPGTRYKRVADLTNDHDFLSYGLGKAALYGVYDPFINKAFVSIGMFVKEKKLIVSGDTPEFAVDSIERWLVNVGVKTYSNIKEILILADAGGSNGYRTHMWKVGLQNIICNKYNIKATVCHFPPGASKWNPIEHRLFSEISRNWKGTPLIDYETVLKYTQTTKTEKGLEVEAILVDKQYKKGMKASEDDLRNLNINYHEINPSWNYTISPN
ncbi:MAG: ISAzo13 family transposase [Candidatus Marinimicrobia bacterium]|nr:ISAzo13 family transposase [Candidatus Neomarinimicrobiota bacterium]